VTPQGVAAVEVASPVRARDESGLVVPVFTGDATWGERTAPITVVVFSDLQCPFCAKAHSTVEQLEAEYGPKQLRVVWRHNPLPFHKAARPAAEAAIAVQAAGGNDAFWRFIRSTFMRQPELAQPQWEAWAAEAGVAPAEFRAELARPGLSSQIDRDLAVGRELGVYGTPSFRINGLVLSGAQPYEKFKELIDRELAAARGVLAQGIAPGDVYAARLAVNFVKPEPAAARPAVPEDTTVWNVPVTGKEPQLGPSDAPVTLVVFGDFECPFTQRFLDVLQQLRHASPKELRVVWRDNPLPFHRHALRLAVFMREVRRARGDDGFWKAVFALHERLNAGEGSRDDAFEDEALELYARAAGAKWAPLRKALEGDPHGEGIALDQDLAASLEARGTPTSFLNGRRVKGAQSLEVMQAELKARLRDAQAQLDRGTPRAKLYAVLMKDAKSGEPFERREMPAAASDAPALGPADAKATLHLFADLQCPFSARFLPTLEAFQKEHSGELRIVWHDLPLDFHREARRAAEAAREAHAQGGDAAFWAFVRAVFAAQPQGLELQRLLAIAASQGLDVAKMEAALVEGHHRAAIDADVALAQSTEISGTPSSVLDGLFLSGARDATELRRMWKQRTQRPQ